MCENFCKVLGFTFLLLFGLVLVIVHATILNKHDREKEKIWQQAADRGCAKKVETSAGTHYIWIEK
jgi:ABC-type sulfate transport system permease component